MAAAGRKRAAGKLPSPPSVNHLRGGVGRDSDQCNVVCHSESDLGIICGKDKLLPGGFVDPLPPAKPSNASSAAGPSTSVLAEERVKEATFPPVDESDEYWWDNNAQIFSMRYNKKVRYVPDQPVSEIPTTVLESLFIPEDKETLEKYNEGKLANLQAHLAFSSALVSKYIFDQSSAKDSALEEKENYTKQLRQLTAELEVKMKTLEKELITEKKKMKAKRMAHKKEIDNLNAKKVSVVNELDRLRNEHASHMKNVEEVEMKLETEMTCWKFEKEDLLAQIADLKKKQQKVDALDGSLRLDDPAIIESEAAIFAETSEGEDLLRPAAKTVLMLTGASSQPLPEATYNTVSVADLRLLIEQVLREKLTNELPLEAFGKKMNEFAQRSQGTQNNMVEAYNVLAGFQQRTKNFEETTTMHKQELGNLSEDRGHSFHESSVHFEQIKALQDDLTRLSSESNRNQTEILKLFEEATRQWAKHDVVHSINSRLDSLDEIIRLERLTRGQENTTEANSLRMEGFQICINDLVSRGVFPRELLDDMSFMDMVKDKDGLLLSLNSGDNLHWRHYGSPRIHHHDTRMQFDNRPLSPWDYRSTSRSPPYQGER